MLINIFLSRSHKHTTMKQRKNAGSDKHNGRNNNKASKLSVPPSATQQERANDEIINQVPVKQSMRELLQ